MIEIILFQKNMILKLGLILTFQEDAVNIHSLYGIFSILLVSTMMKKLVKMEFLKYAVMEKIGQKM